MDFSLSVPTHILKISFLSKFSLIFSINSLYSVMLSSRVSLSNINGSNLTPIFPHLEIIYFANSIRLSNIAVDSSCISIILSGEKVIAYIVFADIFKSL